jgi:Ca-activated chloride channel family protein
MNGAEWHLLRPLWLLLLLPAAWLVWRLVTHRGGAGAWRDVVDPGLLRHLLVEAGGRRSRLPYLLLGIGWLVLVVALAGPTWRQLPQPVYQSPIYRVVVLDLSLSMNTADVKPSRLAQARFRAIDLIDQVEDGQVAMIAYGGEPYVVSPLTGDGATITAQVPLLGTELLPTTGPPRADLALDQAADLLAQAEARRADVILLTDGIREADRAEAAAWALRDAGHRVSVLAFGTDEGGPVPMPGGGFARNARGEVIVDGIDMATLSTVARAGGGEALRASASGSELARLVPREPGIAATGTRDDGIAADRWQEEGPWLLLLLLPLAALAFRRGWLGPSMLLLPVLLLPPTDGHALSWEELWLRDDQLGYRALQQGRAREATELFEAPDWRAAAAYRSGDYARTLETLGDGEDAVTAYNRGNALAQLGRIEDAIAAYDAALAQAPDDADARFNRDLLQDLLDRQQQEDQSQAGEAPADDEAREGEESGDAAGDGDSEDSGEAQGAEPSGEPGADGESGEDGQSQAQDEEDGASGDDTGASQASPGDSAGGADDRETDSGQGGHPGTDESGQGGDARSAGSDPDAEETGQRGADDADAEAGSRGDQRETDQDAGRKPTGDDLLPGAGGGERPDEPADGDGPADQPGPGAVDALDETADARSPGLEALPGDAPGPGGGRQPGDESIQAIDQMLRRVEDDPGGLLRQRFLLQHLRRHGQLPE